MRKVLLFPLFCAFVILTQSLHVSAAAEMCTDLFNEDQQKQMLIDQMAATDKTYDAEFRKLDEKIRRLEKRIQSYSELTGSETNRSAVEANTYTSKIKEQIRVGLTDKVIEKIGPLFKHFEVDLRVSQRLKNEVIMLRKLQAAETSETRKQVIEKIIKGKQAEKNILDKHIGQNYYKYVDLKVALNKMTQSKTKIIRERAEQIINEMDFLASSYAENYGLKFKKLSVEDVKRFVQSNIRAQHAMLKKAAIDEFFLMLRLMTFSGPIVNSFKAVVYKIPENIIMGPFKIPARKVISEAFQVGYNQHLRTNYVEDIETIIETTNPVEQYEILRSLNVKSETKDELLILFSRVTENTEEWEAIKSVALTKSTENERTKIFYESVMAADKLALEKDAFPLYYQEPGATAFGKLVLGSYVGVYVMNSYLSRHPEKMDSFFDGLTAMIQSLQSLF